MSKGSSTIPIFALDASADWEDMENALEASVEYQTRGAGHFGPLFAFAPLTLSKNFDRWEPLNGAPDFLFLVSIERSRDALLLKTFRRAEKRIGPFASLGLLDNDLSRFFVRGSRAILALNAAMRA